jgi:hypothetical protein
MKTKEYKTITSIGSEVLDDLVRKSIQYDGFQPLGGPSVTFVPHAGLLFVQAMVKYETNNH